MAAGAAVARWMADVDDLFGMNVRSGKRSRTPDRMFWRARLPESGGALSLPTRMQNPAFTWQSGRGGKDLASVSTQFGDTLQMAGIRQYSEMEHTCIRLAGAWRPPRRDRRSRTLRCR